MCKGKTRGIMKMDERKEMNEPVHKAMQQQKDLSKKHQNPIL
jgi:hypothetical protein